MSKDNKEKKEIIKTTSQKMKENKIKVKSGQKYTISIKREKIFFSF